MDNNNIEKIAELVGQAQVELIPDTHIPAMVVSNQNSVTGLEHLMATPLHYKAKLRTKYINQFTTYINNNKGAAVFISESRLAAEAIFDMGNIDEPEWGHNRAHLIMSQEAGFQSLNNHHGDKHNQEDIIDFIEDWQPNIAFYCDEKEISTKDAVNRIRRIKINQTSSAESNHGDFKKSTSAMESIEITAEKEESLPEYFTFTCSPYADMDEHSITCKLRAHTNGREIYLSYRISGLTALEKDLTDEFCKLIEEQLNTKSKVTIGSISYQGS